MLKVLVSVNFHLSGAVYDLNLLAICHLVILIVSYTLRPLSKLITVSIAPGHCIDSLFCFSARGMEALGALGTYICICYHNTFV